MAISTPVTFTKIRNEFGGTGPFSDYIRGGTYTHNNADNQAISTTTNGLAFGDFDDAADVDSNNGLNWNNVSSTTSASTNSQNISLTTELSWSLSGTTGSGFVTATVGGSPFVSGNTANTGQAVVFTASVFSGAASGTVTVKSYDVVIDTWTYTLTG